MMYGRATFTMLESSVDMNTDAATSKKTCHFFSKTPPWDHNSELSIIPRLWYIRTIDKKNKEYRKPMATIKDIVLIHLEDAPVSFARIESILPDHKKDWYQIKLLMLQIPLQVVTWILKDAYINGEDFFMNGKKMRLDVVECPPEELDIEGSGSEPKEDAPAPPNKKAGEEKGKIISFADLKNSKSDPEPDIG